MPDQPPPLTAMQMAVKVLSETSPETYYGYHGGKLRDAFAAAIDADRQSQAAEIARLRAALTELLAVIQDSDQRPHPPFMRLVSIVAGWREFAAIDQARATLRGK